MRKLDALAISLLLGGAGTAGAAAALKTVHLGTSVAATRPPRVADAVVAARAAKLDHWSAQLAHAKTEKPPALPAIPRYAPVVIPTVPAALDAAPAPAPPPVRHVVERRVVTVPAKRAAAPAPAPAATSAPAPAVQTEPAPAATPTAPAQAYSHGDDSGAWEHSGGGDDDGGYGGGDD